MTKVKICGLKSMEDVKTVNRWKPDFAGFVFAAGKRQITSEQAARFRQALDREIPAVGVFVNTSVEEVAALANEGVIQFIQLHGEEDASYIRTLRKLTVKPVIKAVAARNTEEILRAQELPCQYLLLDAYCKESPGGNGKVFDWKMIPSLEKPWFLAGGLSPENVEQAMKTCRPFGVDVSSGVEIQGKKSERLIREFIEKVRG